MITMQTTSTLNLGLVVFLDPAKSTAITTLAKTPLGYSSSWVRVAPNNSDLVVNEVEFPTDELAVFSPDDNHRGSKYDRGQRLVHVVGCTARLRA